MGNADDSIRREREQTVREHMDAENALDFDTALGTFGHPRYELIGTGITHDGPEGSRATSSNRARPCPTSATS